MSSKAWGLLAQSRRWWGHAVRAADSRLAELHRAAADRIALQYHHLDRLAQVEVESARQGEVTPADEIVGPELKDRVVARSIESR